MRWRSLPVVGGAYSDETKAWSVQDCVNFLPTPSEQQGTKSPSILRCVPGLVPFSDTGELACRGLHVVQGSLYGVFGDNLYAIDSSGVATSKGSIGGVGRVQMAHNQIALGSQLVISASTGLTYVYNTVDDTLVHVTDEGFPGAIQLAFLDGYIIGVDPSRHFVFHSQISDALSYNSLDHFQAEALPDLIQGIAVTGGQLWVFGDRSIQPFRNRGSAGFVPSSAALLRVGCANGNTIAEVGGTLAWLADDGTVRIANGYQAQRISTRPLEQAISGNDWSQAFAFGWEDRGHAVYYLTMLDGQTWGYDLASGQWHRRQSYGLDKWRVNDLAFAYGDWFGGDYVSGNLYRLDWSVAHENGQTLERRRTMGYIADDGNRIIVNGFRLDVETGAVQPPPVGISGDLKGGALNTPITGAYTATGGTPPYTFTVSAGFPTGLTLSGDGSYSGTVTQGGQYAWDVTVTDSFGQSATLHDTAQFFGYVTSAIYPVQSIESMIATGKANDIRFLTPPMDKMTTSGRTSALTFTVTTAYKTYDHHDDMTVTGKTSALSMVVTTVHETYSHHDDMTATGKTTALSMVVTTNYISYANNDAMTVTGKATGVHLA